MSNWIGPTVKQLWNYAMHVLHNFFVFNTNTTAFCLGRSSLHLLLLKSSMPIAISRLPTFHRDNSYTWRDNDLLRACFGSTWESLTKYRQHRLIKKVSYLIFCRNENLLCFRAKQPSLLKTKQPNIFSLWEATISMLSLQRPIFIFLDNCWG